MSEPKSQQKSKLPRGHAQMVIAQKSSLKDISALALDATRQMTEEHTGCRYSNSHRWNEPSMTDANAPQKENLPANETVTVFTHGEIEKFKAEAFRCWGTGKRIYQQSAAYILMLNTGPRDGSIKALSPRQVADLLGHSTSQITELYCVKKDISRLSSITEGFEI